ncbi:MAG: phosphotransferase [Deltaproteobacteria bacterium]|nr:phosphotransferase [Deltaproteobacteria bacterium]
MEPDLGSHSTRPARNTSLEELGLPTLPLALDPSFAEGALRAALGNAWPTGAGRLERVETIKIRAGRRAVLRFVFAPEGDRASPFVLIGKIRAKGADRRVDRIARSLRERGFTDAGAMGFVVPRSFGCVPALALHLQEGHGGVPISQEIGRDDSTSELAHRVGSALARLHRHGVDAERIHRVGDELAVLERDLQIVARGEPIWSERLGALLDTARSLAPRLADRRVCPVHRDFHPDQVLVEDDRLVLLDLDLYAFGDPLLDVANFVAHLREQALRELGIRGGIRTSSENSSPATSPRRDGRSRTNRSPPGSSSRSSGTSTSPGEFRSGGASSPRSWPNAKR